MVVGRGGHCAASGSRLHDQTIITAIPILCCDLSIGRLLELPFRGRVDIGSGFRECQRVEGPSGPAETVEVTKGLSEYFGPCYLVNLCMELHASPSWCPYLWEFPRYRTCLLGSRTCEKRRFGLGSQRRRFLPLLLRHKLKRRWLCESVRYVDISGKPRK